MTMNDLLLGLHQDPFLTTVVVGLVWPMVQAALDKPWWTRRRRVVLLVAVALVSTAAVWLSGAYPATWRLLVTQMSVFLGVAWSVFQVLSAIRINGVSVIDWVGAVTPGGDSVEEVRAAAVSNPSPRVVDGAELASRD
mgnify:CR=1 FL=1|jgi:hypothetical protein